MGQLPEGDRNFDSLFEASTYLGTYPPPGAWRFMSRWCEMRKAEDGKHWSALFQSKKTVTFDRWTCVEIMLKCNSAPDKADGEQAIWIEGEEVARWGGFRWRTDPRLKVSGIQILNQISPRARGEAAADVPRRLWVDDLVVSRSYVGPLKP